MVDANCISGHCLEFRSGEEVSGATIRLALQQAGSLHKAVLTPRTKTCKPVHGLVVTARDCLLPLLISDFNFIFIFVLTIQITVSNQPLVKNTVDLLVGCLCLVPCVK